MEVQIQQRGILFEPLKLPCGVTLKIRIAKSAMSDSSMESIACGVRGNRAAAMQLLRPPVQGYCDCFLPSPNNQMTYLTFAGNYLENLSLSLKIAGKPGDLKAMRTCRAEFQAAIALLSQFHGGDEQPNSGPGSGSDLD